MLLKAGKMQNLIALDLFHPHREAGQGCSRTFSCYFGCRDFWRLAWHPLPAIKVSFLEHLRMGTQNHFHFCCSDFISVPYQRQANFCLFHSGNHICAIPKCQTKIQSIVRKRGKAMRELKWTDGTCPLPPPSPRPLKARKPQVDILEGGLARSVNRNSVVESPLTQKI